MQLIKNLRVNFFPQQLFQLGHFGKTRIEFKVLYRQYYIRRYSSLGGKREKRRIDVYGRINEAPFEIVENDLSSPAAASNSP